MTAWCGCGIRGPASRSPRWPADQGWVYTVCAVTVDGRHLLASGGDATVRLWDPLSGEQVAEMVGHHGGVYAVCAVTVGGRDLLASGSSGGTVRLWDPRTGEQVAVLAGHQRELMRCAP